MTEQFRKDMKTKTLAIFIMFDILFLIEFFLMAFKVI